MSKSLYLLARDIIRSITSQQSETVSSATTDKPSNRNSSFRKKQSPTMGQLLSVPSRLDELQVAIGEIKATLNTLIVPNGNEWAQLVTIQVLQGEDEIGHGCLIRDAQSSYYLLSAAHVLVPVAATTTRRAAKSTIKSNTKTTGETASNNNLAVRVNRQGGDDGIIKLDPQVLYVTEQYVASGSHDFGVLKVKAHRALDTATRTNLSLGRPSVGSSLVARGRVFLRGPVTSDRGGRFSIHAHSVPGSSGAPLFNDNKALVGLVHGSSKHRGHAAREGDDAAVVYADTVDLSPLRRVGCDGDMEDEIDGKLKQLFLAEDVPLELAEGRESLVKVLSAEMARRKQSREARKKQAEEDRVKKEKENKTCTDEEEESDKAEEGDDESWGLLTLFEGIVLSGMEIEQCLGLERSVVKGEGVEEIVAEEVVLSTEVQTLDELMKKLSQHIWSTEGEKLEGVFDILSFQ